MTLKPLIAKVQTLRRQVPALADDTVWREFLANHASGQRSTRAMTERQLTAVVDALHRAGAPRVHGTPRHGGGQMGKIRALWIELAKAGAVRTGSEEALAAFVKRQTGQDLGTLPPAAARAVIEALKAWAERAGAGR
jgi:phage gp16-like protein